MGVFAKRPVHRPAPLLYKIADLNVVTAIRVDARGALPLYTQISGEQCAVAYTDLAELKRVVPEGYRIFQLTVPELLKDLPPTAGLIVDPHAASPLFVPADARQAVMDAGLPFPYGAYIKIKASAEENRALLEAARPRLTAIPALRRLYLTRYQVEDARNKILAVYDYDRDDPAADGADRDINDALLAAVAQIRLADPMQIIWLQDIPEPFRTSVLDDVPPCYERDEE